MTNDISSRIKQLPKMSTPDLRALWRQVFSTPPHPKLRRELIIPILAYRIQEQAYGGLSEETLAKLRQLARELGRNPNALATMRGSKPGTRMIRQWAGDTHEVTVVGDGYLYRGKHYKSLSAIARHSLDAQREACEAFIASQKHEGWTLIKTRYDDGGFSGGSMERPALKQLLADIAAGKINTVVVYKIDRLTRSLLDFSKIVEAFDAKGVSFVSVTQQFNTTTSMGRLTLNILLSFA